MARVEQVEGAVHIHDLGAGRRLPPLAELQATGERKCDRQIGLERSHLQDAVHIYRCLASDIALHRSMIPAWGCCWALNTSGGLI